MADNSDDEAAVVLLSLSHRSGAHEEHVAFTCHRPTDSQSKQADERAGFLIAAVLGESRNDVADRWMKRVSFPDQSDHGFRRRSNRIDALSLL